MVYNTIPIKALHIPTVQKIVFNKKTLEVYMRKALAMILALTFGMSVWAEGSPDRTTKA